MCFKVSSVRWQRLPADCERACFGMTRRGCPHLVDRKKTFCSCLCGPFSPGRGLFLDGALCTETLSRRGQRPIRKISCSLVLDDRLITHRIHRNFARRSSRQRMACLSIHHQSRHIVAALTDKPLNDQIRSQDFRSILEFSCTMKHLLAHYFQVTQPQRSKLYEPYIVIVHFRRFLKCDHLQRFLEPRSSTLGRHI